MMRKGVCLPLRLGNRPSCFSEPNLIIFSKLCQVVKLQVSIMFHYVYVIENDKNGSIYIGYTKNLEGRLKEHNRGLNFSTKPLMPWHIIYCEVCLMESDARRREKYLKTNQGSRLLKRRLKDYFYSRKTS